MTIRIIAGDCREVLRTLPAESVHCCVTSPPFWGLRDYGHSEQIGLEQSPDEYVAQLVAVFQEVWRVLRKDGTAWLNLGDSYFGGRSAGTQPKDAKGAGEARQTKNTVKMCAHCGDRFVGYPTQRFCSDACGGVDNTPRQVKFGMKPKDLVGIPWRVALALQADGWWLRSDIIWAKGVSFCPTYNGSVMPESTLDRPTRSHEYVFLLAKGKKYYFDMEAIKEPVSEASIKRISQPTFDRQTGGEKDYRDGTNPNRSARNTLENFAKSASSGRHPRTVWTINLKPYRGAHFACYPPALITPMIKAGSSERGCCSKCQSPWGRITEKVGKSTYQRIKEEQGIGHLDMKREAEKRGVALKCSAEGWGGTRNANGTTPHLDNRETVTTGWQPTCTCGELVDSGALDPNMGTGIDILQPYEPVPCTILDPFSGAGTTGLVADRLGRNAILIDLNPDYCQMAYDRIKGENPMFTEVTLE